MKKTMRGYSWICLVAGLVWLACGQMEAVACQHPPPEGPWETRCCKLADGDYFIRLCPKDKNCCGGEGWPASGTPGKPRLTLKKTGAVIIQDTPVALYPPKGAPLEFSMLYNSHGGFNYAKFTVGSGGGSVLVGGGGLGVGWRSILGEQWTHQFRWGFWKSSANEYTLDMPDGNHEHLVYDNASDTTTTESENPWHASERYQLSAVSIPNVDTNLVMVKKLFWGTMEGGQKKGCATCGGNSGDNQSDILHPPYSAWHASEGFIFEGVANGNYRLLQKISPDGEALTCRYNTNNLLSFVTNSLGDRMSFYYSYTNIIANARLTNIQVTHAGTVVRSASFEYDNSQSNRPLISVTDMATNTFYFSTTNNYPTVGSNARITAMRSSSTDSDGNNIITNTITISHGMEHDGTFWTSDWTCVTNQEGDWRRVEMQRRESAQDVIVDSSPCGTNRTYYSTDPSRVAAAGSGGGLSVSGNGASCGKMPTNIVDALGRVTQYEYYEDEGRHFLQPYLRAKINPDGTREEYDYTNEYQRLTVIRYYTAPTNEANDRQLYQEKKWYYTDFPDYHYPSFDARLRVRVITNEVWGLGITNDWVLFSRTVTEYARDDRGTGYNDSDDVYTLVSKKKWIDVNTFAETRYLYDTNTFLMTNIQQRTSSNGDFRTVQNFRWNQTNQLTEVVDALNYTNGVAYDDYYRVASAWQYRTNLVTRFTYDSLDQVLTKVYPDDTKEAWTYNSCLCGPATYTNRDGSVSATIYDRDERPIHRSMRTAVGTLLTSESYAYDGNGRITNTWDATSNSVQSVYNVAGDLTGEIDALGRQTTYEYSDISGQLCMVTRPDATFTSNRYDIAGRLVAVCQYDANTYSLATNQYGYDGKGRQVWTKDVLGNVTSNEYDMLGRVIRTTYPDGSYSASEYDLLGNLVRQARNDVTTMTSEYDELNRRSTVVNALDQMNRWTYDPDWPDHVQCEINAMEHVVVSNTYDALTGLLTNQVRTGVTNSFEYDEAGRLKNTTFCDGTVASRFYDGPRMTSQVDRAGYTNFYQYDILGRVTNVLVSGHVKQVSAYDEVGNMINQYDALGRTNSFAYDVMNRQTNTIRPDGDGMTNQYDAFGWLTNQFGAGQLPVAYGYDVMGRMTNLVDGKNSHTQWQYDNMGRLIDKKYADNKHWYYDYNTDGLNRGWLTYRQDGNQAQTYYTYNALGQLTDIQYPANSINMGYDTLGRMTSRADAAGTWYWTYKGDSSLKATEQLDASVWGDESGDYTVAYEYNELLELTNVIVNGASVQQYSWSKGRLDTVYVPAINKTFQYHWNTEDNRLDGLERTDGGLRIERTYDAVGQLLSVTNHGPSSVISEFAYTYDKVGRRTNRVDNQTVTNVYDYDSADQLTNAIRNAMVNHAANAAYDYTYEYDAVGNRLDGKRRNLVFGGQYNNLNQLTNLSVTGKIPVYGESAVTNIRVSSTNVQVSVYNEALGKYSWLGDVSVPVINRGTGGMDIGISAWNGTNHTVTNVMVYLPPENPQPFQYDDNGNLLDDGLRAYAWDAENRLTNVEVKADMGLPRVRSVYTYDAQGRRVRAVDYAWDTNSNDFVATNTRQFIYDGWNLIAEKGNGYTNFMVWGLDLSGTLQGAGGVGGLLARISVTSSTTNTILYAYDGSGNVTDLVDANGTVVGCYDYDPFGNTVSQSGAMAQSNPFRFSTKYSETQWNLCYYGYRYYSPGSGRWINRDPIGEGGGLNLYAILLNNLINDVDFLGLYGPETHRDLTRQLALAAGASPAVAERIANANQGVDDNSKTNPTKQYGRNWTERFKKDDAKLRSAMNQHFPIDPEKSSDQKVRVEKNSRYVNKLVDEGIATGNPDSFGKSLHPYQDSWAHENKRNGHGIINEDPYEYKVNVINSGAEDFDVESEKERTGRLTVKGLEMAEETYDAIVRFLNDHPCLRSKEASGFPF